MPIRELDMADVALCARRGILETTPAGNPLLGAFEELLVPDDKSWFGENMVPAVALRCDGRSLECSSLFLHAHTCLANTALPDAPRSAEARRMSRLAFE